MQLKIFLLTILLHKVASDPDPKKEDSQKEQTIETPEASSSKLDEIYDSYALINAIPTNFEQLAFLQSLKSELATKVDFWLPPGRLNHTVVFIIPNEHKEAVSKKASEVNLNLTVTVPNLQKALNAQSPREYTRKRLQSYNWDSYFSLISVTKWMEDIVSEHKDMMSLVNIGKTYQGNRLLGVYIETNKSSPHVFVEGGLDSRAWISTAFVTYLINEFANARENNKIHLISAMDHYNWHLFPCLNPDGYEYSHYFDRNWNKNRRPIPNADYGVNLNFNFDYEFATVGVEYNSSEADYPGPKPFSENETQAILRHIKSFNVSKWEYYFSVQGFGQAIILPYANTNVEAEGNFKAVRRLALIAAEKSKALYNTPYKVGNMFSVMGYMNSGRSADYMKHRYDIPVAVTLLLRDDGTNAHALPPKYIMPACEEATAIVIEMVNLGVKNATTEVVRKFHIVEDVADSQYTLKKNGGNRFFASVVLFGLNILSYL